VTLSCTVQAGQATLSVQDQGEGIPADQLSRVFDRFYRVDAARSRSGSRRAGGFGLGLAIANWAVQAHGGRIEAESVARQGSVFRIVLPSLGR
jgi:two-component system sensor histidine kinase SenX3